MTTSGDTLEKYQHMLDVYKGIAKREGVLEIWNAIVWRGKDYHYRHIFTDSLSSFEQMLENMSTMSVSEIKELFKLLNIKVGVFITETQRFTSKDQTLMYLIANHMFDPKTIVTVTNIVAARDYLQKKYNDPSHKMNTLRPSNLSVPAIIEKLYIQYASGQSNKCVITEGHDGLNHIVTFCILEK